MLHLMILVQGIYSNITNILDKYLRILLFWLLVVNITY